jgi:hypothetical protein
MQRAICDFVMLSAFRVSDVGSPGGLTLDLRPGPGMPAVQPAGCRHRPAATSRDLLDTPVDEASLVSAALAEVGHGAAWVKVIADFPDLAGRRVAALGFACSVLVGRCRDGRAGR